MRKFLGIVDDNLLFTIHSITKQIQEVYFVPLTAIKTVTPLTSSINALKLVEIEN